MDLRRAHRLPALALALGLVAPIASGGPVLAAAPASVTIAGSLQSEVGCPGDWDPACSVTHLVYDSADDVWQGAWTIPAGSWEYKAALNDSWDVNYGLNATLSGANVPMHLAAARTVRFYYDDKSHWVTDDRSSRIPVAAGTFQDELGCPADWDPGCLRSWLEDPDGDGVYSFQTTALPAGHYETLVAIGESWDTSYGRHGVTGGANIQFTVPYNGAPMTFRYAGGSHRLTINGRWAWATVRQPAMNYTPDGIDQGNSTGSPDSVEHTGTGTYTIWFGDMADAGGIVHVTALGAQQRTCDIAYWGRAGDQEFVAVECFTAAGARADAPFTVSFLGTASDSGLLSYLLANKPSAATEYTAPEAWSYNSSGAVNRVRRTRTGRYRVTLRGLGTKGGDVQVTALSGGSGPPPVCGVRSWAPAGHDLRVDVLCWKGASGAPADARFALSFFRGEGPKGFGTRSVAYLWADRPTATSYVPDAARRHALPGGTPHVERTGRGVYSVKLPSMPRGGDAQITPYGSQASRCQAAGIEAQSKPQKVVVRCFDFAGHPADSRFTLAYER